MSRPSDSGGAGSEARWQQVKDIFQRAVELEVGARGAFLEAACGDRLELRREVESLLSADERRSGIFSAPVAEAAALALHSQDSEVGTERLGSYRLVRVLGRGGTATVYLAVRDDDLFQRKVAVKVIEQADSASLRRRFERERHILASLDHPSIARLLDAGTTSDDCPYLVMELVEGDPIDRFCDRAKLTLEERLQLFLRVCDAVEHAHRNQIVHRDLKPANVLVNDQGWPKLLDFGIARILGPSLGVVALHTTQPSLQPLTPLFASPEQVQGGREIGPASDVYALGVLLHVLLCGRLPYVLQGATPREVERAICELDPQAPSRLLLETSEGGGRDAREAARCRGTTVRALRRQLQGDLDAVVLTALRKEPAGRYPSVAALADDLRRHLEDRPIAARRETVLGRSWRRLRRHRVAAGLLLGSVFLGGVVAWQASRLSEQRQENQRLQTQTQRLSGFLEGLFEAADPSASRGAQVSAREVLDAGAQRIEAELAADPALRAPLFQTLGRVYGQLGLFDAGGELVDKALTLRRQGAGGRQDLAATLGDLAFLRLGAGQLEEAEALSREAHDLRRGELGEEHPSTLSSLTLIAEVLRERQELDRAEDLFSFALDALRRRAGSDPLAVAEVEGELGLLYFDKENFEAAEPLLRRSLAARRHLRGDVNLDTALVTSHLGLLLERRGDHAAAVPHQRRALEIYERLKGSEHFWVSTARRNLARSLTALGRLEAAEALLRPVLEFRRRTLDPGDPGIAYAASELGTVLCRDGRIGEGKALLVEAVEILPARGEQAHLRARTQVDLGECHLLAAEHRAAAELFEASLPALEAAGWERTAARARAGLERARTYTGRGS